MSGDDESEEKQELRAEKWNKKRQTTVLKDFISLFENNTGDGFSSFHNKNQKTCMWQTGILTFLCVPLIILDYVCLF